MRLKRNHFETPLFTAMKQYRERNVIPFDVPGHKHGRGISEMIDYFGEAMMELDVNSMIPLDNLANPIGVIREAEELLADLYDADNAFFLINGTTSGIQGMIMTVCNPGEKIILPRNVHKSAINGLILSGAVPVYVLPEICTDLGISTNVSFESMKKAIDENPEAKAVMVINPNYYGTAGNLEEIVAYAHSKHMAVLVDEAHGAHLPFSEELPPSAMQLGADMSSVSLHKTGGSLTQTSALLTKGPLIDPKKVKTVLNLTQSTSASYLLMSSLDVARKMLAIKGKQKVSRAIELSRYARRHINQIEGLHAFGPELVDHQGVHYFDETKLGIKVADIGLTGFTVYEILREEYNIQVEFGDFNNILAIISVGDIQEDIEALIEALKDIAQKYGKKSLKLQPIKQFTAHKAIVSPRTAFFSHKRKIKIIEAENEISGESIMVYPPGIPIVAPGEKITKEIIDYIELLKTEDSLLTGCEDPDFEYINVLEM